MQPLWPEHEAWLIDYQMYLNRCKEPSTVKMYLAEVRHFLGWLEGKNKNLPQLSQGDIISFRDEMVGRGRKIATINKWTSVINSFQKWAIVNQIVEGNLAGQLRFLEYRKDQPRWLSREEEQQLLEVASLERNPNKKSRNEALIYTMLYAGLRIEEVSLLEYRSLEHGDLVIYEEQVEKRRLPITDKLQVKLLEWMKYRSQSPKKFHQNSPFLFVTERSGNMQPRSIQYVVEGYSEKTGFSITCQMLRHTFCRRLVEQKIPLEQVKKWAGHKTIQSTMRYLGE